jgi:hypothetical protein
MILLIPSNKSGAEEQGVWGVQEHTGKFHDQRDAKWIVIKGELRGHNDTPFGRPTPSRHISRPGVGCLLGYLVFSVTIN